MNLEQHIPLPFTCQHEHYTAGVKNEHGNRTPGWLPPETVACTRWPAESTEPASPPTGGDRVRVDAVLVVDADLTVDHRDKFTIDGRRFEVVGLPKNYDHGPFGFTVGRQVVELKWVG